MGEQSSSSHDDGLAAPTHTRCVSHLSIGSGVFCPHGDDIDVVELCSSGGKSMKQKNDDAGWGASVSKRNGEDFGMISSTEFSPAKVDVNGDNILGKLMPSHGGYFAHPSNIEHVNSGGVIFSFTCHHSLQPYEQEMVRRIVNLSSFADETVEIFVPHIVHDMGEVTAEYTPVMVKASYILPGISSASEFFDPKFLASSDYQKANQPQGTRIWEDDWLDDVTFRMTRAVVPFVHSITIQFKVSRIDDPEVLLSLSEIAGTKVDCGLLLERTKRSVPPKQDRTRKVKSVLLYTELEGGGVLVNHFTVILQSSVPAVVEGVIDHFGTWGCQKPVKRHAKLVDI